MEPSIFLTQLFNAITLGLIYGLMGISLTLIWSIANLPDFAQGGIYIISAYAAYFVITLLGLSYPISVAVAALVGAGLSVLFERLLYARLRASELSSLLCAIALFFFLENLAIALWTPKAKIMKCPTTEIVFTVGGVNISCHRLVILGVAITLFILIELFVRKTKTGMAIRAAAQDMEIAPVMGINVDKIYVVTWAIGGALVGIASTLISPLYAVWPGMGTLPLLKGLVIVILGGLGSFIGALVAGLILGIIETFGAAYVSVAYQHGFAFIILLLTLSLRPRGLFGRR